MSKNTLWLAAGAAVSLVCAPYALQAFQTPPSLPLTIDGVSTAQERADLTAWIKETFDILRSKAFIENLTALSPDYSEISFGTKSGTPAELVKIVELQPPYRYFPTPVALHGDQWNEMALTGHNGELMPNGGFMASMTLGRKHFRRYRSRNAVERSCAINTLAHEISHTITDHPQWSTGVIKDTGVGAVFGGEKAIASYLIGSVAQCTYLVRAGRITKDQVRSCVATFGDSAFYNPRCDQFDDSEPVQWPKPGPRP